MASLVDAASVLPLSDTKRLKPTVNTRASRACHGCRKQKTRCFTSPVHAACLRCLSLGTMCSFEESKGSHSSATPPQRSEPPLTLTSSRPSQETPGLEASTTLAVLLCKVDEILHLLKGEAATPSGAPAIPAISEVLFGMPSTAFRASPFHSLGSAQALSSLPLPLRSLLLPQVDTSAKDIISLGILTIDQATQLLQLFRDRYGRWVSFSDRMPTAHLVESFRVNLSILLTTCCCLALRYSDPYFKSQVYHHLLQKLQVDLQMAMMQLPQPLEFMKALVILLLYGLSLLSETFVIDAWFLSGSALQHFLTNFSLGTLVSKDHNPQSDQTFQELTAYRMWNHLTLVHLANCNFSGRACIIDQARLSSFMEALPGFRTVNNFDGRMVAEISLQSIVYRFIRGGADGVSLDRCFATATAELAAWSEKWKKLLEQPASQFVLLDYHYSYLMVFYNYSFMAEATVHSSYAQSHEPDVISKTLSCADTAALRSMLYHSHAVVEEILRVGNDSYFAFLSDQIHFCTLFSASVLIAVLAQMLQNDTLDPSTLAEYLQKLESLALRFRRVATGESDVVMNYAICIERALEKAFPGPGSQTE